MAGSRCALRFHCIDSRVGLDFHLARNCSRNSDRDHLAPEVSEGAGVVLDSAVRVAFLGGLRGSCLGSAFIRRPSVGSLDRKDALIEKCIPQNIARW